MTEAAMICGAVLLSVVSVSSVHLVDYEPGSLEGLTREQLKDEFARLDRQVPSFTGPIIVSLIGTAGIVVPIVWLAGALGAPWVTAGMMALACVAMMAGSMVLTGGVVWLHHRVKERAPMLARLGAIRERLDRLNLDERWPDEAAPPPEAPPPPPLPPSFGATPQPSVYLAVFP